MSTALHELRAMVSFLASPAPDQLAALPALPVDRGARDFYSNFKHNPLIVLVREFLDRSVHEDNEPWEDFLARAGLPDSYTPQGSVLEELRCVLSLLLSHLDDTIWTQKGLAKTEWKVVRRLASAALSEFR